MSIVKSRSALIDLCRLDNSSALISFECLKDADPIRFENETEMVDSDNVSPIPRSALHPGCCPILQISISMPFPFSGASL